MLTFMATQIGAEKEKEELLHTFKALDTDGNGVLTPEELKAGLKQLNGLASNEEEIDALIVAVDSNMSGNIDFTGIFEVNSRVRGCGDQSGETALQETN